MKVLALIPARGGSKRILGKNIRALGGKPLILWTINAAHDVPGFRDIIVSTDCPAIAQVAREGGATVPWLRPSELADDTSSSISVCIHAMDWYEREIDSIDCIMLLQPTSPFRSATTIGRALEMFRVHRPNSLVSLSPIETDPKWLYQIHGGRPKPFLDQRLSREADNLPSIYKLNGSIYMANAEFLRVNHSFIGEDTMSLIIEDPFESLDIDTEWDWLTAESALKTLTIPNRNLVKLN